MQARVNTDVVVVASGECLSPAGAADRGGHEEVVEDDTFLKKRLLGLWHDLERANVGVLVLAPKAHILVVSEDEDDVRLVAKWGVGGNRGKGARGGTRGWGRGGASRPCA